MSSSGISASDWVKGISFSLLASAIGGASKLAIRKSWLMEQKNSESDHRVLTSSESTSDEDRVSPPPQDASASSVEFLLMESSSEMNRPSAGSSRIPANGGAADQLFSDNSTAKIAVRSASDHRRISRSMELARSSSPQDDNLEDDHLFAHQDVSSFPRKNRLALLLRGSGMLGMSVFNPLCCVLAMNYASPSILAPFSGLTTVWIVIFSYPVIGELPSMIQVIAALFIILGEVIVAVFGDHTNDEGITVRDVTDSYAKLPFIAYFVGLLIWMMLLWYWIKCCPGQSTLHRFAWGVSGGSVTGLQNFLKDALTVLKATSHGPLPVIFYVLLVFAGASAFGGLLLLTACMKRYDATYSSAMFVGSFVVSASVMSAVHYQTFEHVHGTTGLVLYPSGLAILMAGVYLLVIESQGHDDNAEDDQEERSPLRSSMSHSHLSSPHRSLMSSLEEDESPTLDG